MIFFSLIIYCYVRKRKDMQSILFNTPSVLFYLSYSLFIGQASLTEPTHKIGQRETYIVRKNMQSVIRVFSLDRQKSIYSTLLRKNTYCTICGLHILSLDPLQIKRIWSESQNKTPSKQEEIAKQLLAGNSSSKLHYPLINFSHTRPTYFSLVFIQREKQRIQRWQRTSLQYRWSLPSLLPMESLPSALCTVVFLLRMVFRHLFRAWIAAGTFSGQFSPFFFLLLLLTIFSYFLSWPFFPWEIYQFRKKKNRIFELGFNQTHSILNFNLVILVTCVKKKVVA